MLKIDFELVREYLTPCHIFSKYGNVASAWKLAFHAAGSDKFQLPVNDELRWLVKLVQSPLVGQIEWTFHEGADVGTWIGETKLEDTYAAWESYGEGVITSSSMRNRAFIGTTADDAKRLAQIHWSMTILSGLSDDFLSKLLAQIADEEQAGGGR